MEFVPKLWFELSPSITDHPKNVTLTSVFLVKVHNEVKTVAQDRNRIVLYLTSLVAYMHVE